MILVLNLVLGDVAVCHAVDGAPHFFTNKRFRCVTLNQVKHSRPAVRVVCFPSSSQFFSQYFIFYIFFAQ